VSAPVTLPRSFRSQLVSKSTRDERGHPDIRIARRAETIARLAAVAHERGEVSDGLRRVLVVQAVRLAYLSASRLAMVEGRSDPDPTAIDIRRLVGNVLAESADPDADPDSAGPTDAAEGLDFGFRLVTGHGTIPMTGLVVSARSYGESVPASATHPPKTQLSHPLLSHGRPR